jgi:hypothetical protein
LIPYAGKDWKEHTQRQEGQRKKRREVEPRPNSPGYKPRLRLRPSQKATYHVVAAVDGTGKPWANVCTTEGEEYAREVLRQFHEAGVKARLDVFITKPRSRGAYRK